MQQALWVNFEQKTGIDFDLPTEAQWEYACRAGSTGNYGLLANGKEATLSQIGVHNNATPGYTTVGTKLPNAWGLYDMHGNVAEWCLDKYGSGYSGIDPVGATSGSLNVVRGGRQSDPYWALYASYRGLSNNGNPWSSSLTGFRVAAPSGF